MQQVKKIVALGAALSLGLISIAGGASATPPSGTTPGRVIDGTLDGPVREKADGVTLRTKGDATVRQFELTYAVGGYSGCHSHPGLVIATVEQGTVQRETPDGIETFTKDDSFIENGPHFVSNVGTEPAILAITQIFPAGAAPRTENDAEDCESEDDHDHEYGYGS